MNKQEVLARSDMFRYLDDEEIKVVAEMGTAEVIEAGTVLCKRGYEADKLYVIEEGLVAILLELGKFDQRQIQSASNFETVIWSALIPPHVCTTTVKAVEKTKVFAFNGQDLRSLIDTNPRLYAKISDGLGFVVRGRLRSAFEQLMGVTYQD
ncbi:cyclic nucleotide-binding domain-containing protein [Bacteroidota bacterium]